MSEILQPQQVFNADINLAIFGRFSPRQRERFEIGATQMAETMPTALPFYKSFSAVFGPLNTSILKFPASHDMLASWDCFYSGTNPSASFVTVRCDQDGKASFLVVDDSQPSTEENRRFPRSFRRPKVKSTSDPQRNIEIVRTSLINYLDSLKLDSPNPHLESVVEGPTAHEPYVLVRSGLGVPVATYRQDGCVYEIQGMLFKPTISADNRPVQGLVNLHGKKII